MKEKLMYLIVELIFNIHFAVCIFVGLYLVGEVNTPASIGLTICLWIYFSINDADKSKLKDEINDIKNQLKNED